MDSDSDSSLDEFAHQLEDDLMAPSSQKASPRQPSPRQQSPKTLLCPSVKEGSRSPLSQSLRERILVRQNKSAKKQTTMLSKNEKDVNVKVPAFQTDSSVTFAKDELMNLSDSDEENKLAHSNILKCDRLINHENSAFIKFVKASDPTSKDSSGNLNTPGNNVNVLQSKDIPVSTKITEGSPSVDKRRLSRSNTGSFDFVENSRISDSCEKESLAKGATNKSVESSISSIAKDNDVQKSPLKDISDNSNEFSPNRPITRKLTRSLSLSSDSLVDDDNEEISPSKRKSRSKTSSATISSLPKGATGKHSSSDMPVIQDNRAIPVIEIFQPKKEDKSLIKTNSQTNVIRQNAAKDAKTSSNDKDLPAFTPPSRIFTRSRASLNKRASIDEAGTDSGASFLRSKGKSKIPSGKGRDVVKVRETETDPSKPCDTKAESAEA